MKTIKKLFLTLILASLALTDAQAANSDTGPVSLAAVQEEQEVEETKNQSFWERHKTKIIIAASALSGAGLMWLILRYATTQAPENPSPSPSPTPPPPPLPLRDEWNLPNFFTGKRAQHLRPVLQTDGWSCGYHALSNAAAIEELAKTGGELTAEKIRQTSEKYLDTIMPKQGDPAYGTWPLNDELIDLSEKKLPMDNIYQANVTPNAGEPAENQHAFTVDIAGHGIAERAIVQNPERPMEVIFKELKTKLREDGSLHFATHRNGNHWSLISIVKPLAQQPRMIITDSKYPVAFSPQDSLMPIAQSLYENLIG